MGDITRRRGLATFGSCQDITCGPCAPAVGEVRGVEPPELLLAVAFDPDLAVAMALARMRLIALEGRAAAAAAPAHRHVQVWLSTTSAICKMDLICSGDCKHEQHQSHTVSLQQNAGKLAAACTNVATGIMV